MSQQAKCSASRVPFGWGAMLAVWAVATAGVWVWMTQYACSGSLPELASNFEKWPADSNLARSIEQKTLVVFLHPHCPCSMAAVQELDRVLTSSQLEFGLRPKLLLVTTVPADASTDWFKTKTIQLAKRLPGAEVYWDREGLEARRFKAATSGEVRMYGRDGQLLFGGGITIARGHAGASLGSDMLLAALKNPSQPQRERTPVFGCRLVGHKDDIVQLVDALPSSALTLHEGAVQ